MATRLLALALALLTASQAEEESCAAGGQLTGGCLAEESELDGIAKDIRKMCPLVNSSATPVVLAALRMLPKVTGTMSMMSLWPKNVHPEDWADDYTVAVITIIARILLGIYKTRDKDYVNIPTGMLSRDDIAQVENVHAPHLDPDGSPNFYWFEAAIPGALLRSLYVRLNSCFYSVLRRLNTENGNLFGRFEDDLDKPDFNTWEAVLKNGAFKSKREWVMGFYEGIAHTWDKVPLWPAQMTNFQDFFKQDEWTDQLEYAIAFHLIGAHRLESGSWNFDDIPGFESVKLPFRIALNGFSSLEVRQNFGKYGVDLYFNDDGLPVLLQTPEGDWISRGDKQWQYWKFVWRSSLVTGVTLVDHLHVTHFRVANLLSRSLRVALAPDDSMRRFMSIFTFGSIFVNIQALHTLLGPNHMLHRATPFKNFAKLSHKVPEGLTDVPEMPCIKVLTDDKEWEELHPRVKALPYYADGRLLMGAIKKLVERVSPITPICEADGKTLKKEMMVFMKELKNETLEGHYQVTPELLEATEKMDCNQIDDIRSQRLAAYIFMVTGFHRHVGFVGDYYGDPSLATMSWKSGEAFGRPRQHMIMSVVNVFTSTRQPLLKEDYTHLFSDLEPELSQSLTKAWRDFQSDLKEVEEEIDRRNEAREIKNINMSPKVLECAVAK